MNSSGFVPSSACSGSVLNSLECSELAASQEPLYNDLPVRPNRRALRVRHHAWQLSLAVALVCWVCLCPASGQTSKAANDKQGNPPQVRVDPQTIRIPVVDGADIRFSHLTPVQAPSQTRVSQIIQDNQGFLWFGTQQGLSRYDGYRCKVFAHDPAKPDSFGGSFVYSLFKDRSGFIWVGSDQSLDRFDPATEAFIHFRIDRHDPIVTDIGQDASGMLWLSTESGLYRLNPENGQVTRFAHDPKDPYSLTTDQIQSTGEDREGGFWVVTGAGVDRFDRATGKVTLHVPLPELVAGSLCSVACRAFHEDRFGVFWIIYGSGNGLAVLDRKRNKLTKYSFYQREPPNTALTGVNALLEDHNGTMWFGTMGNGLLKFDRTRDRFIRYKNDSDPESLAENRVISLFEDREGNIWTGFHAVIPDFFANGESPFKIFRPAVGDRANAGENLVNAIYKDRDRDVWMGAGGFFFRIDPRTERYSRFYPSGPGVSTEVLAITQDRDGMLWLGTLGYGLTRLDPRTGQIKVFRHKPSDSASLSNDTVARILIQPDGIMWISTWDGLDRFDPASGAFVTYKSDPSQTEPYYSILHDRKGILWLGGKSGLSRFDPSTGQFTLFLHNPQDSNSLSNNTVDSVSQDRKGAIWIGTQDGLDKLQPDSLTFSTYTSKDGLSGNAVSCILVDDNDNLWMSTNRGLSTLNSGTKTFKNYSVADGLPGNDLTGWDACFRSPSGEMLFGGFAGAVEFQPSTVLDNAYVPPVVFTDFHLAHGEAHFGPASPLDKSITAATSLKLPYAENFFSVEFAALSFRSPSTNRYRYMLQGLDTSWHEVTSDQRLLSYTSLPPGDYKLAVQGATSRGAWNEPGALLQIRILPPWWGTWWFRTICVCSILWLGWQTYRYHLSQIRRQFNIRVEERVNERTRIARELHDTLLQSFHGLMFRFQAARNMLPSRPEEASQALDGAILRAEQAIAEGRSAIQDLRSTPRTQSDLVQAFTAIGQELIAQNGDHDAPHFQVIVEGERQKLFRGFQEEIYRMGRELLQNAFKHAHAKEIEAEIRYGRQMFRLLIRDDGKGIDAKVLKQGGRPGHWGLPGLRERAQQIGAHLDFWSEAGAGTEIELTAPARTAYETSHDGSGFRLFRKRKHEHHS